MRPPAASWLLEQEARALLTRLDAVQPFAVQETYVAAAAPSPAAMSAIEQHLLADRRDVRRRADRFLTWLHGPGSLASAAQQQHEFWSVRLDFQNTLAQFDLFSEVITQRSESGNGVLLAGLDIAAAEALLLEDGLCEGPPIVCVLHRGLGGAIRRARTRLPGGDSNPVAIIRIPRERMVGYGIASSLVHEVGHQGAALLGLVESLREDIRAHAAVLGATAAALWELWVSEIVADLWAVSRIGIGSTLGLVSLVSLPRGFVFRPPDQDPHPVPWLRVILSCALGDRLYPHPQWRQLAATWRAMYPLDGVSAQMVALLERLTASVPAFTSVLLQHRSPTLRGARLGAVLHNPQVAPHALLQQLHTWRLDPRRMATAPPTVAFAALGQGRASGVVSPERESELLRRLISTWAVSSSLELARAISRTDADMFVGQPKIWATRHNHDGSERLTVGT